MANHPENPGDSFESITQAILAAQTIGVVSHQRPDGDALGSCIGIGEVLSQLGKTVHMVNADPVPESLQFLAGTERIQVAAELSEPFSVDLLIILDAAGADRVGNAAWAAFANSGLVINIDHHVSNQRFGDLNYVDVISPATGQIVFELIKSNQWTLSPAARDALFAAISTDTGSFRYPNTTGATYRIAADMIDLGADVGWLSQQLYESYPQRRIELLRGLLQNLDIREDGKIAAMKLTRSEAEAVGMRDGDTEGLIDVIRSVDSVVVAVFFEELKDGKIRVSSRSKSTQIDVGQICAVFGGGGHKLAAGARISGPIEEAAERFLNEVAKRFHGLD